MNPVPVPTYSLNPNCLLHDLRTEQHKNSSERSYSSLVFLGRGTIERSMKSKKKNASKMIIRKMRIQDYESLIALWKEGNIPYRPRGRDSKKNIQQQLRQSTSLYFVAENKGKIVGAILGTHDGRKGWINRLVVTPTYRRKGIAKRLIQEAEQRFVATGIDIVACLIEGWNDVSAKVFERLGYRKHPDILYYSKRKNENI
jgi:ribosomal protein S18 acetylase RimI-like enzyme